MTLRLSCPGEGSQRLKKMKLEQRQRKRSGTGKLFPAHDANHETDGGFGSKDGSVELWVFVCQPLRKKTPFPMADKQAAQMMKRLKG